MKFKSIIVVLVVLVCSVATSYAGKYASDPWENCITDCVWNARDYDCPSKGPNADACCERKCDARYKRPDPNRQVDPEDYGYTREQWECYNRFDALIKLYPGAAESIRASAYRNCGPPRYKKR